MAVKTASKAKKKASTASRTVSRSVVKKTSPSKSKQRAKMSSQKTVGQAGRASALISMTEILVVTFTALCLVFIVVAYAAYNY